MLTKIFLNVSATKKAEKPVCVIVIKNRKERITVSTGIKVAVNQWDDSSKKVVNLKEADIYNGIIKQKYLEVADIVNRVKYLNAENPFEAVRSTLIQKANAKKRTEPQNQSVWMWCEKAMRETTDLKYRTILSHHQSIRLAKRFAPLLTFKTIDKKFVQDFHNFLIKKEYAKSTIWGHHKNIKLYLNKAISNGLIPSDPLKNPYHEFVNRKVQKSNRCYLTQKEVDSIKSANLPEHLHLYRDLFLFLCYTGLRVSDLLNINSGMYVNGILTVTPQKTDEYSTLVALPLQILYAGEPDHIWAKYGYNFPLFENISVKINLYIKLIAEYAGIKKHLSCHVARHTFLTNIAQRTGDIFKVMKLGGLRKPETAMIYIHLAEMDSGEVAKGINWD